MSRQLLRIIFCLLLIHSVVSYSSARSLTRFIHKISVNRNILTKYENSCLRMSDDNPSDIEESSSSNFVSTETQVKPLTGAFAKDVLMSELQSKDSSSSMSPVDINEYVLALGE